MGDRVGVQRFPPVVLEPRSVDVFTAAKALGLSEHSCREEIAAGRLRTFRYGVKILVPVAALDEWLAARMKEQAT
jgi:excisionase family DNA binding protein